MTIHVLLPGVAVMMFAEGLTAPGSPFAEFGPFAQMGAAGVFVAIWLMERKERKERQVADDARYAELQTKLLDALKRPVRCPYVSEDGAVEPPRERR